MGGGSWSASDWDSHSKASASKPVASVYKSKGMKDELNPYGVKLRESCDSVDNPESNAIIVALDVTGSMGEIARNIATKSLGILFQEILDRKPVKDPHLMFMAIGDVAAGDRAPLQVSQFEADNRIVEQLTDMYLEGGGGGNQFESYHLPWYFASMKTSIDCFKKRGKKGYLFTMGDENPPGPLTKEHISKVIGDNVERDYTAAELLQMAERSYHVFHIIIEEGNGCKYDGVDSITKGWTDLMGQRAIRLSDYTKLSEVIVSLIQVTEGADKAKVAKSWSGDTSLVVSRAIGDLTVASTDIKSGVVRL